MKQAFDCIHAKHVVAWALTYSDTVDGVSSFAGRVVADFSRAGVCTLTIHAFGGPLDGLSGATATAGGGGYCKVSTAFQGALRNASIGNFHNTFPTHAAAHPTVYAGWDNLAGRGVSEVRAWLNRLGYEVLEVL